MFEGPALPGERAARQHSRAAMGDEQMQRAVDVVVAALALAFLLPLLVAVAVCIRLQDGGAIFFAQERVGRNGRTFRCFKFRSMVLDADARLAKHLAENASARAEWEADHKLRRDPRITPLGVFLRKSSIDEIPQLLNVLRGEMSIFGPRPIVRAEASRYGRHFSHYTRVRPGITGLWQVSGRNNVSYRRRVACDVLYVRRRSTKVNLLIMTKTIPAVLLAKGSY
jgi:lipopolysaccharide/colanic/teichoic acid biosynthesis glycosyltransferase